MQSPLTDAMPNLRTPVTPKLGWLHMSNIQHILIGIDESPMGRLTMFPRSPNLQICQCCGPRMNIMLLIQGLIDHRPNPYKAFQTRLLHLDLSSRHIGPLAVPVPRVAYTVVMDEAAFVRCSVDAQVCRAGLVSKARQASRARQVQVMRRLFSRLIRAELLALSVLGSVRPWTTSKRRPCLQ